MKINIASTKLSFFLIALLLIFIILSAIIPQKNIAANQITNVRELLGESYIIIENLKLDEIYTTPYFFILLGLISINLTAVNMKRFKIIWKTEKTLIRTRHLGSIVFHFSLLLIILGVILNFLFKFEGIYGITEGQIVRDSESDYSRIFQGPLRKHNFDRFQLTLNEVNTNYLVENAKTDAAIITITNQSKSFEKEATIRTNFPLKMEEIEFHFGQKNGYSPKIQMIDSSGEMIFSSFVRLAHQKIDSKDKHADFFELPELNMIIGLEVVSEAKDIDSTLVKISITKDDINILEDTLFVNQVIDFGNQKLIIPEMRRWCYINVVESPYLNLIFFAFWSALTGMMIGLIGRTLTDFGGKG